ncbi:hypothetical protein [Micromonospora tarensis]|uniref:Uncharacterized protein n=1 Tax=Micromonospora tarensis TaxID=2806100 RepID=A0ABS1YDB4_9ACTN|nr:hypothetical protein [Micromonospora tarensis]MBM0275408.1 hypothetical protein [Micromonospora tarensis]
MTDLSISRATRNTFQQTFVGLEYETTDDQPADLFSRACVEQYLDFDPHQFGYLFAQVFESEVLREVALLEGVPFEELDTLRYQPTATIKNLAELVENSADLDVVEHVNLAAALISISRFGMAERLLASAATAARTPLETFETAMLEFVVSNRRDDGAASQRPSAGCARPSSRAPFPRTG